MSWPQTLADYPLVMQWYAFHGEEDFDPTDAGTQVKAPCCGRRTPAFTIVALHGLTTEIRGGNVRPKTNLDWACDGCLHLLILDETNGWTWSKLYRALGAPADIVRYYRAREIALEQELASHAAAALMTTSQAASLPTADSPVIAGFNPQTAFDEAYASLPDTIDIPGTETPLPGSSIKD